MRVASTKLPENLFNCIPHEQLEPSRSSPSHGALRQLNVLQGSRFLKILSWALHTGILPSRHLLHTFTFLQQLLALIQCRWIFPSLHWAPTRARGDACIVNERLLHRRRVASTREYLDDLVERPSCLLDAIRGGITGGADRVSNIDTDSTDLQARVTDLEPNEWEW